MYHMLSIVSSVILGMSWTKQNSCLCPITMWTMIWCNDSKAGLHTLVSILQLSGSAPHHNAPVSWHHTFLISAPPVVITLWHGMHWRTSLIVCHASNHYLQLKGDYSESIEFYMFPVELEMFVKLQLCWITSKLRTMANILAALPTI